MTLATYDFAYGNGRKTFQYDSDDVLKVVRTEPFEVMQNVHEHVLEALYHPIGLPPVNEIVKPGDTVAFICNDPTRIANSEIFMPILVNEMNKLGVPDENMKIVFALGTHRAMTPEEMERAIEIGAEMVQLAYQEGTNIISFGELGMANTSASSVWMYFFTGIPLKECVGAGSGLDNQGIEHKYQVLKRATDNYQGNGTAEDILRWFGGFEMVAAAGGMLQAAELGMTIIIDGFIMTNCILAASKLHPEVLEYCVFGHQGDEAGHKSVLEALHAKPLLNLGLRLGEGTGAICAYPIIESAIRMINEMSSFKQAAVTKYF